MIYHRILQRLFSKSALLELLIAGGVLLLLSLIVLVGDLDFILQQYLYSEEKGWAFGKSEPWNFLYEYGPIPGLILGAGGVLFLLLSFFGHPFRHYRKGALFLTLILFFGGWLLVHVFKETMDRPRPREVQTFQGESEFVPLFERGESNEVAGNSFPSGHAAIAFYLMSPFFMLRDRHKGWAVLCLLLGVSYGLFMGFARMSQGGHFFSDALWSGGFVYLSCWFFYYALNLREAGFRGG